MPIVNLNANFVRRRLKCPPGKSSIEFTSRDLPGFFVEVTAVSPGVGSYRLRYKENGKTRYKSIGRTNVIDFADAKKKTKELKSMLALGQSINKGNKDDEKKFITYAEFFEQHYKPYILQREAQFSGRHRQVQSSR
jgi:hypothetical protein